MNDTKEKHTPGPWHAFEQNASNPNSKGLFEIDANHPSGNRQTVAVTPFAGDGHELWANARLIGAAPEMYDLLCKISNSDLGDVETAIQITLDAREVLAKVEGGEG